LPAESRLKRRRIPPIRHQPRNRVPHHPREQQPGRSSDRRKQQTLRHHLPQDPPTPRAQGQPYAHLALPRPGSGQQQIRQVRARQQQNKS
jgi:hypothetical protein